MSGSVQRVPAMEAFGIQLDRIEATRPGDEDSFGNGNWHVWTRDGDHHILRRYHVLHTEDDLAYEAQVLDHLAARGWTVPGQVAAPIRYDDLLWAVTRYVPGRPHAEETAAQRQERGELLGRLHNDLADLDLGRRRYFFPAADLDAMGEFQNWGSGIELLRAQRPDLADRATRAMNRAKRLVAEHDLLGLPQIVVHGDFANWNLHFDDAGRFAGVIDFDLCHLDSRAWELVIARVHRAPELIDGYQRTAAVPLSRRELAAIEPLQVVLRVLMVMAELWDGQHTGRFDEVMITQQLDKAGS